MIRLGRKTSRLHLNLHLRSPSLYALLIKWQKLVEHDEPSAVTQRQREQMEMRERGSQAGSRSELGVM